MSVPFLDLSGQYQEIRTDILEAITRTLDSGQYVLGPEVAAFEQAFAAYTGTAHCLGTNNGTSALQLALISAGIKSGDEVITVPHTFVATVAAIGYVGARAVLVDIEPDSMTIDPTKIEAAITDRTRAIMPVHLYGQPANMDAIMMLAAKYGLKVIEDAAQAHGARYRDRPCGSIGHAAGFSFYPGKNLGAYGEGGAVTTSDESIAARVKMLRDWGQSKKYYHDLRGFNMRLEAVQGAVLSIKLGHLPAWTEARRAVAAKYNEVLAANKNVVLPATFPDRRHVYHIYAVRVSDRAGFMTHCSSHGVGTAIHYPYPVHLLNGYRDLGYSAGDFPVAEKAAAEVVSIPMFPEMTADQIDRVAEAVLSWEP